MLCVFVLQAVKKTKGPGRGKKGTEEEDGGTGSMFDVVKGGRASLQVFI